MFRIRRVSQQQTSECVRQGDVSAAAPHLRRGSRRWFGCRWSTHFARCMGLHRLSPTSSPPVGQQEVVVKLDGKMFLFVLHGQCSRCKHGDGLFDGAIDGLDALFGRGVVDCVVLWEHCQARPRFPPGQTQHPRLVRCFGWASEIHDVENIQYLFKQVISNSIVNQVLDGPLHLLFQPVVESGGDGVNVVLLQSQRTPSAFSVISPLASMNDTHRPNSPCASGGFKMSSSSAENARLSKCEAQTP